MTREARGGFVLLEAVVALAILGVASIVLLQVRSQQIRVAVQARELLTAQALAEDRISALKLLDYEMLEDPPDSLMEGFFPPPFEAFSWTGAVELIKDEYDLFGVEVVVVGPVERFPLRTLVSASGGQFTRDEIESIDFAARSVRGRAGEALRIVTPGIRPRDWPADDQARAASAAEAIAAGSDVLVVGRPVLLAPDPAAAARKLIGEIEQARGAQEA